MCNAERLRVEHEVGVFLEHCLIVGQRHNARHGEGAPLNLNGVTYLDAVIVAEHAVERDFIACLGSRSFEISGKIDLLAIGVYARSHIGVGRFDFQRGVIAENRIDGYTQIFDFVENGVANGEICGEAAIFDMVIVIYGAQDALHRRAGHKKARHQGNRQNKKQNDTHPFARVVPKFARQAFIQRRHCHASYQDKSHAATGELLISFSMICPSRRRRMRWAMFLMASLCVTITTVQPYCLFTLSISAKISFEVL